MLNSLCKLIRQSEDVIKEFHTYFFANSRSLITLLFNFRQFFLPNEKLHPDGSASVVQSIHLQNSRSAATPLSHKTAGTPSPLKNTQINHHHWIFELKIIDPFRLAVRLEFPSLLGHWDRYVFVRIFYYLLTPPFETKETKNQILLLNLLYQHSQTMSIDRNRTKIAIEPIECNRTRSNNCDSIVERNRIAIERPISG